SEAPDAKDEFLIAVVGPLASFLVAGLCWALHQVVAPGNSAPGAVLAYLSVVNLLLGAFNLLPGYPLDGGRVLHAILWGATGSLEGAPQTASCVGQAVGFLLILWGVGQIFEGGFLSGLWSAFIGWFLNGAAETTRQQQTLQMHLRGVRVADVMNPHPPIAEPQLPVQEFVFEHVMRRGERALLVETDGQLRGIVTLTDARKLPH